MRVKLILPFLLLFIIELNAQFESGYIVTLDGENKIGYIKNDNWIYNPDVIVFKEKLNAQESVIKIGQLKEFGFGENEKFIVQEVDYEMSSDKLNALSNTKNPILEKRVIALRKLIDGYISLYEHNSGNGLRFFTKKGGSAFESLIYKKYTISSGQIARNEHFKQQLILLFKEERFAKKITQLSYTRKALSKIVTEYNVLENGKSISYVENLKKRSKFNIIVNGGIEQNTVSYQHRNFDNLNPSFENYSRFVGGVEFELLVFNERIGLFSGYTFKGAVNETIDLQTSDPNLTQKATLSYKNNSLSFGMRGYVKLNKDLNIILSGGFSQEFIADFSIDYELSTDENFNRNAGNTFIGVGIGFKKFLLESRFDIGNKVYTENISNIYDNTNSGYAIRLGYKLL